MNAMKMHETVDTHFHAFLTLHWTDMGDQLHVPASLPQTLNLAECYVETIWTQGGRRINCNGFDKRVARQQLCKHSPTRNNR
jgi:hypothetical protein